MVTSYRVVFFEKNKIKIKKNDQVSACCSQGQVQLPSYLDPLLPPQEQGGGTVLLKQEQRHTGVNPTSEKLIESGYWKGWSRCKYWSRKPSVHQLLGR